MTGRFVSVCGEMGVRQMALRGEAGGHGDVHDREIGVSQQLFGALNAPDEHILMRGLSNGGFEGPCQVKRADFNLFGHGVETQIAVQIFFDEFDQTAHFSA